jgi:hypothetical protein
MLPLDELMEVIKAMGFEVEEQHRTEAAYGADGARHSAAAGATLLHNSGGDDGSSSGDCGYDDGSLRPDRYRPVFFVARKL